MVKTRVTHKTLLFEGRREGDYLTAAIISNIVHWGGGEAPHMKGVGMLVGNFELNPKGDRSGRGPSFISPLY